MQFCFQVSLCFWVSSSEFGVWSLEVCGSASTVNSKLETRNSKQVLPSGKLWWTFLQKGSYTLGAVLRLETSHLRFSFKTQHRFEFSGLAYVNSLLCCSQCNRKLAERLRVSASNCAGSTT